MKIPKKLKIGGHKIAVVYPHKFKERTDAFGYFNISTNEILITNIDANGHACSESQIESTFWHEVFHVINHIYCCRGLGRATDTEDMVEALAQGMVQFLRDNFKDLELKDAVDT